MRRLSPVSILLLLCMTVAALSLVSCGDSDEPGISYSNGEVRLSEDMVRAMAGQGTIRERNIKIAIGVGLGVLILVAIVFFVKLDKVHKVAAGIYKAEHGDHTIEIECNLKDSITGRFLYSLIIDNTRVDTTQGGTGEFTLRGELPGKNDNPVMVIVKIHARTFKYEYTLEIDGTEHPMTKT